MTHSRLISIFICIAMSLLFTQSYTASAVEQQPSDRQRILVLTDIEADPDDAQSLARLLLYANQIDLEGLVATNSVHQKTMIAPDSILSIIEGYAKVWKNLAKHEEGFPKPEKLRALVKRGSPVYGMAAVGPNKNTEGSDWIVKMLEKKDDRPLWISVWGGANTLAQALHTLKETKSETELKQLISKLRVYTISDQDDSGPWIRKTFPDLFYIVSPGGYGAATWTGIHHVVDGVDNTTLSNEWLAENIQQAHGPLGALYPDVAYGMEGDTPAYLNLIPNGLSNPEYPHWGGWGGRYELYLPEIENMDPKGFTGGVPVDVETRPIWTNAIDRYTPTAPSSYGRSIKAGDNTFTGFRETLWRWRDDFQNDFAARMDWTVNSYAEANHPPVPVLQHPERITVKSNTSFFLDARGSQDPDGDSLTYWWFNYAEAGSLKNREVKIHSAENMARVHVVAPDVKQNEELHYILKVTDRGLPPLTRYKRVIVTVTPK